MVIPFKGIENHDFGTNFSKALPVQKPNTKSNIVKKLRENKLLAIEYLS
jgi:hypothetical protein